MHQAIRIALVVTLIGITLIGVAAGVRTFLRSQPLPDFTFLITGTDLDAGTGQRADTIVTGRVRPDGTVAILSIPRDTLAAIPGAGEARISQAFAIGGLDLLRRTVEGFLGVRMDHTAAIDLGVLERIVDALGGVELEVRERMFYQDQAAGLTIDLQPGLQVLTGSELAGFVRYRSTPGGDFERIDRQKRAVAAILNRSISESSPATIAQLLAIAAEVPGDLDLALIARWADRWRAGLAWNWMTLDARPLDNGDDENAPAYLTATREAVGAAVEATFGEQAPATAATLPARVLVLDATGETGPGATAARVASRLERLGWRVELRAAPATATSLVEAGRSSLPSGRLAAGLLGIARVNEVWTAGPGLDVRITIGSDLAVTRPNATVIGRRDEALALAFRLAREGWEVDTWLDETPAPGKISYRPAALSAVSRIATLLPRLQPELDHRLAAELVVSLPR